jgi:hypothetical protein
MWAMVKYFSDSVLEAYMCIIVEPSRAHTRGGIYTRFIPIVEYLKERKIFGMYAANQSFNHAGRHSPNSLCLYSVVEN